jgi:large subunit ribosomal protein L25
MSREELVVQERKETGKDVKKLRRAGYVPGVVYGITKEPLLVSCEKKRVEMMLKSGRETELVDLRIDGVTTPRVVLVQDIQVDPIFNKPTHIDFYEPNLNEPVDVDVAFEFVGESPAVEEKRGILLKTLESLPVRVLPTSIPNHIEVDISSLVEVGDQIGVVDISLPEGVELMLENPEDIIVAKINILRTAQEEEEAEEEAAAQSAEIEKDDEELNEEASGDEG